jgi:hypothetical protein
MIRFELRDADALGNLQMIESRRVRQVRHDSHPGISVMESENFWPRMFRGSDARDEGLVDLSIFSAIECSSLSVSRRARYSLNSESLVSQEVEASRRAGLRGAENLARIEWAKFRPKIAHNRR